METTIPPIKQDEKDELDALGFALKRVYLAQLAEKIETEYGESGILLFRRNRIQIVKADFQGLALLSSKTEFEVLREFDRIYDLVVWMEARDA